MARKKRFPWARFWVWVATAVSVALIAWFVVKVWL